MTGNRDLSPTRNAAAVHQDAELAGMSPEQFLYVSVGFEALKKAADSLPDLLAIGLAVGVLKQSGALKLD
jgi:hypothetical protein